MSRLQTYARQPTAGPGQFLVWARRAEVDGEAIGHQWKAGDWLIYADIGLLEQVMPDAEFTATYQDYQT